MKVNQLKAGSIITYVQIILNIVISIVYTPIMLRILGPSEHGLYSTVSSTISWLSILTLGFGGSYIRYYAKYKASGEDEKISGLNGMFLTIFSVLGTIALVCGIALSFNLKLVYSEGLTQDEYATAKILALIITLNLALSFPASVFNGMIRSQEKFIQVKVMNLLQTVCSPLLTLPILLMGYGSIGMVVVTTVVDLFVYTLNIFYCFRKLKVKIRFGHWEKGLFRSIAGFSLFIALNSIIGQINTSMDKILLGRFVGTASVSVYAIGFSLYVYFTAFSTAISSMFVPRIHQIVNSETGENLRNRLTEVFVRLGRLQFLIQALMFSGIIFFGRPFILFWAGEGYENAYYIALLLCGAAFIPQCQMIGVEVQRAQNKHKVRTIVYSFMALANVVLTVLLIRKYGELGAPVGTAIAVVTMDVLFMNWYYHKKLNFNVVSFWSNMIRIVVGLLPALGIGVLIMRFAPMHSLWLMLAFIAVYVIVFGVTAFLLSMNRYERDLITTPLKKMFKSHKKIRERENLEGHSED